MRHKPLCPGIWQETLKNVKNENCTLYDLEYGKKTDQKGKAETHMVGHGIRRETLTKMENEKHTRQDLVCEKTEKRGKCDTHCRTSNMARKQTNVENEKLPWQDMKYGQKHLKTCKMKHTLQDPEYGEKTKNFEKEKHTLQYLKYGEKH